MSETPEVPAALLAYCAGVIDSDGTIRISRTTWHMSKGKAKSPMFVETVQVLQVTPEAIDLLKGIFGGTRMLRKSQDPAKWKPLHLWRVTDAAAAVCLKAILPYLRIKRTQAENCLALHDLKQQTKGAMLASMGANSGIRTRPQHLTEAMEFCYAASKMLNTVGVQASDTTLLEAAE